MDDQPFDHLTLQLASLLDRRRFGQVLATLGFGAELGLGLGHDAGAKKKK